MKRNGQLFSQRREIDFPELPILEVSLRTGVTVRNMEDPTRRQQMTDRSSYQRAVLGDVAYNMMRMWQGAVGVAPVDGLVSPAYVVARPNQDVESEFFVHFFRTDAFQGEVDNASRGIVKDRNRLYWDQFKQLPVPVPPYQEQRAVVGYLTSELQTIDNVVERTSTEIELIREYRSRLIADVVTGKLDVRATSNLNFASDIEELEFLEDLNTEAQDDSESNQDEIEEDGV